MKKQLKTQNKYNKFKKGDNFMQQWEVCFLIGGHRYTYIVQALSQAKAIEEAKRIYGIDQGDLYAKRI